MVKFDIGGIMSGVGDIIGKFKMSPAEKLALKQNIEQELNRHKEAAEAELTKRHGQDMASDSWLSKNIRPLSLAFLTVSTVALAYLTIFTLEPSEVALVEPWLDLLQILLLTTYTFYFGSRGIEKVQSIRVKSAKSKSLSEAE